MAPSQETSEASIKQGTEDSSVQNKIIKPSYTQKSESLVQMDKLSFSPRKKKKISKAETLLDLSEIFILASKQENNWYIQQIKDIYSVKSAC